MSSFELSPDHFDGSADVAELTDYLFLADPALGSSGYQTREEQVIQAAKNMAVTWIQFASRGEPIGWRYSTNQLVGEARTFLARSEECDREPISLVSFAGGISKDLAQASETGTEHKVVRDHEFELKMQLLVDRFRAAGFELPEDESPDVFSDSWKTWRRYGTDSSLS